MMGCLPEIVGHSYPALESESWSRRQRRVGERLTQPPGDMDEFRPVGTLEENCFPIEGRKGRRVKPGPATHRVRPRI